MLPSLESLHCFAEAARLLNFRAAARSVALTPAALGQRVRQLEEQLGQPLFARTTRKVVLTEAGLALLPYAERSLGAARDCLRAGRGEVGPPPLELTLGTRHELGMSFILPLLPKLERAHPGLTLHLYFGSGDDLLIRARTLEIDCAIGSMRITDPRLETLRLHREDYVFVAAPSLLRARPLKTAAHARRHVLVDLHAALPLFGYFRDAPGGGDLEFERVLLMGTIAAIREVVLRGAGVAVLPLYQVQPDLDAGRLQRVLPRARLAHDWFRLLHRADDPRRPIYRAIADALLAEPLR